MGSSNLSSKLIHILLTILSIIMLIIYDFGYHLIATYLCVIHSVIITFIHDIFNNDICSIILNILKNNYVFGKC